MSGPQPKCEYCIRYYGRIYRQGMFMPQYPAHPNCFHEWDVWFPWEKESELSGRTRYIVRKWQEPKVVIQDAITKICT